jgi:hypothetical protein
MNHGFHGLNGFLSKKPRKSALGTLRRFTLEEWLAARRLRRLTLQEPYLMPMASAYGACELESV